MPCIYPASMSVLPFYSLHISDRRGFVCLRLYSLGYQPIRAEIHVCAWFTKGETARAEVAAAAVAAGGVRVPARARAPVPAAQKETGEP